MITKLIESNHYHLWTDAIHARQLSRQTNNKWDRGTYVRWTIMTAWTVLEIACQDALEDESISYSFQKNLNRAISSRNFSAIDWGQGLWQKVVEVQELRKGIAHRFVSETSVFPDVDVAESSINIIREAIKDIYVHCGKKAPSWVDDDCDEGWTTGTFQCHMSGYSSIYDKTEGAIKITYMYKGNECIYDYLAPDTDINQPLENIFKGIGLPITSVRLYRDDILLIEYIYDQTKIRGA